MTAASSQLPAVDAARPVYSAIVSKLVQALSPSSLDVLDESSAHAGHAGVAGAASGETHFKVAVVSEAFEGKSAVQRHRMVYAALGDEFRAGLHALSLSTRTPGETA